MNWNQTEIRIESKASNQNENFLRVSAYSSSFQRP